MPFRCYNGTDMFGHLLTHFVENHRILMYAILFLGMFVEGEMMLIFAGVLVRSRNIHYFDTIIIAFIAVLLHDIGYWYIGKRLATIKKEKVLGINLKKAEKFFSKLKEREGLYIFTSKFAWGLNRFVLVSSGYFQTKLVKLVKYSTAAAIIWTTTLVSLGYIFAEQTAILRKDIRIVAVGFGLLFLVVFYVEYLLKKMLLEEAKIPENIEEKIVE